MRKTSSQNRLCFDQIDAEHHKVTPMSAFTDPTSLDVTDVRDIVRLLSEVAVKSGGHTEKKRRLMEGLCVLVCATAWLWGFAVDMDPEKMSHFGGFRHGKFDDTQVAEILKIHPPSSEKLGRPDPNFTAAHPRSDHDNERNTAPDIATLVNPCDLYPCCLSYHSIGDGKYSGIVLYRAAGSPPLDAREALIVHTILTEVPWLHEQSWHEEHTEFSKLAPRARRVLELLLQSYSRKEIASQLGIRDNTVAGYTKDIYRQFHVRSHVELLGRFFQGNGGKAAWPTPPQLGD